MQLPRDRPTAQQAIEGLTIYQLRRENVMIFDEINALRSDVKSRQSELDNALKQVTDLRAQLKRNEARINESEQKLAPLQSTIDRTQNDVDTLSKEQQNLADDCTSKLEIQQTASKKVENYAGKLSEDLERVQDRLYRFESFCSEALNNLQQELAVKADDEKVVDLQRSIDEILQRLEQQPRCLESVSRVTDTFEHAAHQLEGK